MCPSENSGGASRTRRLDQCSRREARRRLARCHANLDVLAVRDESGTLADSAVAGAPPVSGRKAQVPAHRWVPVDPNELVVQLTFVEWIADRA